MTENEFESRQEQQQQAQEPCLPINEIEIERERAYGDFAHHNSNNIALLSLYYCYSN